MRERGVHSGCANEDCECQKESGLLQTIPKEQCGVSDRNRLENPNLVGWQENEYDRDSAETPRGF